MGSFDALSDDDTVLAIPLELMALSESKVSIFDCEHFKPQNGAPLKFQFVHSLVRLRM